MFKPNNGEMISSDFQFAKLDNELHVQRYFGNKKVVYIREVLGLPIVKISSDAFKSMDETKVIILDKNVVEVEPNAFIGLENVVVYTELKECDVKFNTTINENVTFRFGLKMIYDLDYVFYASFDDGIEKYATIFDHHLLDNLYLSEGRFGEQIQLENEVQGVEVTVIESHAFEYAFNVERYKLPQHCRVIGSYAFRLNTELVSIWTNNELVEIKSFCFSRCRNLTEIIIDDSVRKLGTHLLLESPLASMYFKDLDSIDVSPHYNSGRPIYNGFVDFAFVNGLDYVLFKNKKAIVCDGRRLEEESVCIPETIHVEQDVYDIIALAPASFKGNKFIKEIIVSKSVQQLGESVFEDTVLNKITIEGPVEIIPMDFASNSVFLKEVNLPSSITMILNRAFFYAENLKTMSLPSSVGILGDQCFMGTGLISIVLPDELKSIQEDVFLGTDIRLLVIPNGVRKLPTFSLGDMRELRTLILMNEDIHISNHAITERGKLTIICKGNNARLNENISSVGEGYIKVINGLKDLKYLKGIVYGLFNNKGYSVIGYCNGVLPSELIILDEIESVPVTRMLDYCLSKSEIKNLYIPDSISHIGDYILKDSSIKKLRLPKGFNSNLKHWVCGNKDVIINYKKEDGKNEII